MNTLENLVDYYAIDAEIMTCKFEMMGKMLDAELMRECILTLDTPELYIYGGGYLGIQLYKAICDIIKILAVVDRKGHLQVNHTNIPVINFGQLKKVYKDEPIIIASVQYYQEIRNSLCMFVPEYKIFYLGEFLGGILR